MKYSIRNSLILLAVLATSAIAGHHYLTDSVDDSTNPPVEESPIFPIIQGHPKIKITHCGEKIQGQDAILTRNLECSAQDLNADNAAVSLNKASLDVNGKQITYTDRIHKGKGIFISNNSQVYNSKAEATLISGFNSGIEVQGNHNTIQNLTIENTHYGVKVTGRDNKLAHIIAQNIGSVIGLSNTLLVAEGEGFIIEGNHNQLLHSKAKNIGFNGEEYASQVNSMFVYGKGISITGDDNVVKQLIVKNIFGFAHAEFNAQSTATGIYVKGHNNSIESSEITDIHATGTRNESAGLQTGSMATGVALTGYQGIQTRNKLYNSKIQNVLAEGKRIADAHELSGDITAEAYGVYAINDQQYIINNQVKKVDAEADIIEHTAGIRVVDDNHIVLWNIVEDNGANAAKRNTSLPTLPTNVSALSIDGFNMQIKHNLVHNNFGFGIVASMVSQGNEILYNNSQNNKLYDYLERDNSLVNLHCRNIWAHNRLEGAHYSPVDCFL
jgi:hypothetical protein